MGNDDALAVKTVRYSRSGQVFTCMDQAYNTVEPKVNKGVRAEKSIY